MRTFHIKTLLNVCRSGVRDSSKTNRHVIKQAIVGLHQAATCLHNLKYLKLHRCPLQLESVQGFAAALSAFSPSITHLELDLGIINGYSSADPEDCELLFAAISHFSNLTGLYIRRWPSRLDKQALKTVLKLLVNRVEVGICRTSCPNVLYGTSMHSNFYHVEDEIPFREMPTDISVDGKGDKARIKVTPEYRHPTCPRQ